MCVCVPACVNFKSALFPYSWRQFAAVAAQCRTWPPDSDGRCFPVASASLCINGAARGGKKCPEPTRSAQHRRVKRRRRGTFAEHLVIRTDALILAEIFKDVWKGVVRKEKMRSTSLGCTFSCCIGLEMQRGSWEIVKNISLITFICDFASRLQLHSTHGRHGTCLLCKLWLPDNKLLRCLQVKALSVLHNDFPGVL